MRCFTDSLPRSSEKFFIASVLHWSMTTSYLHLVHLCFGSLYTWGILLATRRMQGVNTTLLQTNEESIVENFREKDLSITALKPKSSAVSVQLHPTGEHQIHYIFYLKSCSLVLFVHNFRKYLIAHTTSLLLNSNPHFVRLTTLTAMSTTPSARSELANRYVLKAMLGAFLLNGIRETDLQTILMQVLSHQTSCKSLCWPTGEPSLAPSLHAQGLQLLLIRWVAAGRGTAPRPSALNTDCLLFLWENDTLSKKGSLLVMPRQRHRVGVSTS